MRKTRTLEESYEMFGLLYFVAYVLACGLGYFFGRGCQLFRFMIV